MFPAAIVLTLALGSLATCVTALAQTAPADKPLPAGAEAWSLFGTPLTPPPFPPDALKTLDANLAQARADLQKAPDSADAVIWVGRRLAYLGRYREALDVFTSGIAKHPADARLYRHRGHRYLTTRRFDLAQKDFEKAASLVAGTPDEVEPDGQPNARNIPTSTLQFNIHYHLGLARYLQGNWSGAEAAYRDCLKVSKNADALVATTHWLYMTLRRAGKTAEAAKALEPISSGMDIIENASYYHMLLVYKGSEDADALLGSARTPLDQSTYGYGLGNWFFYNGRRDRAVEIWRKVLAGEQWAAFGSVAAEADLKRLGEKP